MRHAAGLLAPMLLLWSAACGDSSSARQDLADTADALADVRSGELHMRVTASTLEDAEREVGFDVRGPFALAQEAGKLPELRFTYTDLLGSQSRTTTVVSTGDRAYVERDGRTVAVPDDALVRFRGKADPEKAAALGSLEIDEWAKSPKRTGDRIVAEVDVPKALNDVFGVAASVGPDDAGPFPKVEGDDVERLERAVTSSRLEVVAGDDNVLRSLRLVVAISPTDSEGLRHLLGRYLGARLSVSIELAKVNQAP